MELATNWNRISNTYLVLTVQLLVTVATVMYLRKNSEVRSKIRKYILIPIVLTFVLLFAIHFAKTQTMKFALFTMFSILIGTFCLASIPLVTDKMIMSSLKATGALFISMSVLGVLAYKSGIDLGKLEFILCICLLGLIIATIFAPTGKRRTVFIIGVILFCLFISVDTWNIARSRKYTDATTDALSLYLSVVNLFQQLLGLRSQ